MSMSLSLRTVLVAIAMLLASSVHAVEVGGSTNDNGEDTVVTAPCPGYRSLRARVWAEKDGRGREVLRGDARAKRAYILKVAEREKREEKADRSTRSVWCEIDDRGREVLRGSDGAIIRTEGELEERAENAARLAWRLLAFAAGTTVLVLLFAPGIVESLMAFIGVVLIGSTVGDDDVQSRLAKRLSGNDNDSAEENGGGTRLFIGGISISEPPEFQDGVQRYNAFDGETTFPAGINATLRRERDAGEHRTHAVMIMHGGTQACSAKQSPGTDGGFPLGTVGKSVARISKLCTALTGDGDATICDLNVLSENDRHRQQPTTDPAGTAEAIFESTGPLTHVGWLHTDSNGRVTLWNIEGNCVGLLGTGLEGGEKDMSGLAENDVKSQIRMIGQGMIPPLKAVEDNGGIVLFAVTSTGNTSAAHDMAFDEHVPPHLVPRGSKKRVVCDRQDELPIAHLAAATRKKAAYMALMTGLPTSYRQTHVHFGDVNNPTNEDAIMLDQWVTIREWQEPGYGPVLTDKTDHMRVIELHSRALGVGADAAILKSPVDEGCELKPTRDLWLFDAAVIARDRMMNLVSGTIGPEALRPTISQCITNAYRMICGSGWSPDIDAADVDLQRDANRAIVVETYLPDDMYMTDERVRKLENTIGDAVRQHFKDAVRGTTIRKPVVIMATYIVDSNVCPDPVMEVQVLTHLVAAVDIMMADVPVLIEARLTKQSHRVRGDFKYTHLEHEFWVEGITSLEQSTHPRLVALARILSIIGDHHWKNGALRKDGFSDHINRGGDHPPFREGC